MSSFVQQDVEAREASVPPHSPMLFVPGGVREPTKESEEDSGSRVNWKPQSSSESWRQPGTIVGNDDISEGYAPWDA